MKPRRSFLLPACLCLAIVALAPAVFAEEFRQFTDVVGRTVHAQITAADATTVKVKLMNGRTADIPVERLSDGDKVFVTTWIENRAKNKELVAAEEAAKKRAAEIPVKIVAFCKQNLGKQVGNGECWTLANEAFKANGLKRPGKDLRIWGRQIDHKTEKLQPGDIAEYRSAKFSNGSWTGPEHTAVVVEVKRKTVVIAQCNWAGNKNVTEMEFDPASLVSGELMFYRPE